MYLDKCITYIYIFLTFINIVTRIYVLTDFFFNFKHKCKGQVEIQCHHDFLELNWLHSQKKMNGIKLILLLTFNGVSLNVRNN